MNTLLCYLAFATLAFCTVVTVEFLIGIRRLGLLSAVSASDSAATPRVSIIIPARNEQDHIAGALQSVLDQDYPNLEVIVVNDRSEDRTGAVLSGLAADNPRLKIISVTKLPSGWIGKNHANHVASRQADGTYLLFTDADVIMRPDTIRLAVSHMEAAGLDHLTVAPTVTMPGVVLQMFVGAFTIFFFVFTRPWRAARPRSRCFVGIGAFNMLRRRVYDAIGTHQAIAMRPDDDIKLAKLVKRHGYRQELLIGLGVISVQWYATVGQLIRGLEKNTFAAVEYRPSAVVGSTALQLMCNVWPFVALVVTSGWTRYCNAAIVAMAFVLYAAIGREGPVRWWHAAGFPLMALLLIGIMWRSMLLALWRGGIQWRGTLYPLAELRANRV